MIKNHALDVESRMDMQVRSQLSTYWKDVDFDELMMRKFDNVYSDIDHKKMSKSRERLTMMKYLKQLFDSVGFKIKCLSNSKYLIVDQLIMNSAGNTNEDKDLTGNANQPQSKLNLTNLTMQSMKQTQTDWRPM